MTWSQIIGVVMLWMAINAVAGASIFARRGFRYVLETGFFANLFILWLASAFWLVLP